jgi:5-methylthioribose kinase
VTGVAEIGDGNINNVFRVICAGGTFVLKQSMPYVRIDRTWELTPTRIDHEAAFYERWAVIKPQVTPRVYMFDAANHALAVEDLHEHEVWRMALASGCVDPHAAPAMGLFLAQMALSAQPWAVTDPAEDPAEPVNPIMTQLMEDVLFRFPYEDHPHNSYAPEVAPLVERLRIDPRFRSGLDGLRRRWCTGHEALIHGDLHTGSIMVASGDVRTIDAEFSTLGPIAWDLGELTGNLLIAQLYASLMRPGDATPNLVDGLWRGFAEGLAESGGVRSEADERPIADWLVTVRSDAIGYAGAEMVRRVIGSGKADEIAAMSGDVHVRAAEAMLGAGAELVMNRTELAPELTSALVEAEAQAREVHDR